MFDRKFVVGKDEQNLSMIGRDLPAEMISETNFWRLIDAIGTKPMGRVVITGAKPLIAIWFTDGLLKFVRVAKA